MPQFTDPSHIGLKDLAPRADTEVVNDQSSARAQTCDETRSTRLHYQLRCLLNVDHDGEHRWTPELLSAESESAAATG